MKAALLALAACGASTPAVAPAEGGVRWAPIIDSHVHLAYYPVAGELRAHGVLAAVDLASPERELGKASPIAVLQAGPMLTHPGGYPLDAWGSDGFGIGCADEACVRATVDRLASEGARVIKIAMDDDGLDPALVPAAVAAAHAHGLKVAAHALSNESAARAAAAGVDVLAHTPVERLSDATVAALHGRAVITTLAAFGGNSTTVDNLRRLRAAGLTILYGTDLGNTHDVVSSDELQLMRAAGMDDAAITAAMTTTPAAFWNLHADTILLDADPRRDATTLLRARVAAP